MTQQIDLKDKIIIYLSEREDPNKDFTYSTDELLNHADVDQDVLKNNLIELEEKDYVENIDEKEELIIKELTEKGKKRYDEIWNKIKDNKY
ncbi:MAG: hypothetical protein ACOCSL_01250, partial [Thermoplasmatota archaeon]